VNDMEPPRAAVDADALLYQYIYASTTYIRETSERECGVAHTLPARCFVYYTVQPLLMSMYMNKRSTSHSNIPADLSPTPSQYEEACASISTSID
jgi:hypothetical protein